MTVTFPDGTVTLMPRRAPVGHSGPIRGESLLALPLMGDDLKAAAQRLTAFVGRPVLQLAPATLDIGQGVGQPAIAALGLTANEAERIGSARGLDAVFFWDGRRARLIACSSDD